MASSTQNSTLLNMDVSELRGLLDGGEITSVQLNQAHLERVEQTENLGAFLCVDSSDVLAQAKLCDERLATGEKLGELDGIPVGLKDIILARDTPTTCGSNILESFVAPYDATCVSKLREGGAVLLGKLNMDEFAMGSSNEHSAFGGVKNPWSSDHVPGGSSGGSAAAVAAGSVGLALGTDTGGSIRQPAAFCGIVGLKPTYGRVSRYGVIAFASSLDQVGPMARSVDDCAALYSVISGHDAKDSTSAKIEVQPTEAVSLKGLRLGVPREYFVDGVDSDVKESVEASMKIFTDGGAELVDISLPHTDYAIATYYILCTAEASSNLSRYDGVRFGLRKGQEGGLDEMYEQTREAGFGDEVKRRIMLGTYVLSAGYYDAYYSKAQKVRRLISEDFSKAFKKVDAIITPTTPTAAFKAGMHTEDPVSMYLADIFTVGCNLAGLPGLSLPCGFSDDGLPIGMQLIGAPWQEQRLLGIGRAYQQATDWHLKRPSL